MYTYARVLGLLVFLSACGYVAPGEGSGSTTGSGASSGTTTDGSSTGMGSSSSSSSSTGAMSTTTTGGMSSTSSTTAGTTTAGMSSTSTTTAGTTTAGMSTTTTGGMTSTTTAGMSTGGMSTAGTTTGGMGMTTTGSTSTGTGTTTGGMAAANPFAGAVFYVNPDYQNNVMSGGGANQVQNTSTAVWMDSIDAIAGGAANNNLLSLDAHFGKAEAQGKAANKPVVMTVVVYNLPNRDCAAGASAGKLNGTGGLQMYKSQFIDVIAQTAGKHPDVHVAYVIEPDSLPNLITNMSIPACATAAQQNLYTDGVTYAIQKLAPLGNSSVYLDIGQAGWLGFDKNIAAAVPFYTQLIKTATNNNPGMVRGFATNISNYVPLQEPFIQSSNAALVSGTFYMGNKMFDDVSYSTALQQGFSAAGLPNMHFIVDTSRNGWAKVNNGQPIDKRPSRGDWCNINDAGLGERPAASPAVWTGYDAFMWIKPPGESDGPSSDASCSPSNTMLDAMANAPAAGAWFAAALTSMVQKATPSF